MTDETVPTCLIKRRCDITNVPAKGSFFSDAKTSNDNHAVEHCEQKSEVAQATEDFVFEQTKVTVVCDIWDPIDHYKSTPVEVKHIPFTPSEQALEKTKYEGPTKVDKSTMVHMRRRQSVLSSPRDSEVKNRICDSQIPIQRMSNYIIIGDYLRRLYIHDQLCDVIIHVGSYTFSAHRLALAAHSVLFAEMFLENSKNPPSEITLDGHGITSAAFQAILEHIYMVEAELTLENLGEVHTAAKFLQIGSLLSLCEDLQNHFTPDNALIVLDLSGSGNSGNEAYQRALSVVTSSFRDVRQSGTFLSLEAKRVCAILGCDDLAVTSEVEVFQAALLWLNM
jgi:hypothetical protein